jgi:hypothetical protein
MSMIVGEENPKVLLWLTGTRSCCCVDGGGYFDLLFVRGYPVPALSVPSSFWWSPI